MFNWIGLALLAVGAGGALFFALSAAESFWRKKTTPSVFSFSPLLFFVGVALLGAFAYSYSETTRLTQSTAEFSVSPSPFAAGSQYRVLESKTEVFTKSVSPVECEGMRDLVYWRELRVYNATRVDEYGRNKSVFLTNFILTIHNKGNQSVSNVLVTEHIPDIVAAEPGDVFNFTVAPRSIRKGSVVVEWMFDKIDAGANRSVSYAVEKRVSADALKDFEAPNVVAQAVKAGAATTPASEAPAVTVAAQRASVDWTLPGIVVAMAIVGAVVYYFARKTQRVA